MSSNINQAVAVLNYILIPLLSLELIFVMTATSIKTECIQNWRGWRSYVSTEATLLPHYWEHTPHQTAPIGIVLCNREMQLESRSVFVKYMSCEMSVVFLFFTTVLQMLSNSFH